ncbi:5-hydroxytryptamine (serotonin) receptor 1A [Haematobia irritans]|uniref:5-hydroxytryptamine (serotonin) receptor 1A n=1 Tax=Haematobia irritans TaxID=7368 RepID=UPI003F509C4E
MFNMARKPKFDDALDYIFIANDKNPNTYVISPAHTPGILLATTTTAATTTTRTMPSIGHSNNDNSSNRFVNALTGVAALTAVSVTATSAVMDSSISSNSNSNYNRLPAINTFPSESLIAHSDNNIGNTMQYSSVAVDLGSLLLNGSLMNDSSLLADIINGNDTMGNATSSNMTHPEDVGELIRMAATSVILGLMILITIIGNVFVIAAIILERHLQNVANYLVASLAVADLFVACLVMPLGAVYEISQGWILGPELCDIWTSIDVLCCTASILHLVAIAVDRYWAVTNINYMHSRTSKRVLLMIFFVWTAAVIVSLAPQFGWKDPDYLQRIEQQKCMVSQDVSYQVFATCCTFYVPLLVILVLYWKIYQTARKRIHRRRPKPIDVTGNNNQPDVNAEKKRKRLRLRFGKFTNAKTNKTMVRGTALGLVEGNSTNTVNTVEVEDTEFSSSNVDSKSRAGIEVTNNTTATTSTTTGHHPHHHSHHSHGATATATTCVAGTSSAATANTMSNSNTNANINTNLNNTDEEVASTSSTQIATVSHLVALAHQQHASAKAQQSRCLTQPVTVVENPLEPLKDGTTSPTSPASCTVNLTTTVAINGGADGDDAAAAAAPIDTAHNNHHQHNHDATEVLADPQLQQQLEQVQQQAKTDATAATSATNKVMGGASNATTITSISALSPQTPTTTITPPGSGPVPHSSHATSASVAASSQQVTPLPRPKNPQQQQQQLSSIANPMHKVTKRKETLEAKRERKAAKTLAIITGAFVVCWLPFFVMALLLPLCEACEINDGIASLFLWLGYFNSTLNPVIYTIFSPEFRQAFKRILFGAHRPVHYRSGKL